MQELYRVRLNQVNNAREDQQINGYIAFMGEIMVYTRGHAIQTECQ